MWTLKRKIIILLSFLNNSAFALFLNTEMIDANITAIIEVHVLLADDIGYESKKAPIKITKR